MKLSRLTDDLLDEGYDDMMRKFKTYRTLDEVKHNTPIMAYPIMSKEGADAATKRINSSNDKLCELVGYTTSSKTEAVPVPDELVRQILESEVGAPLIDIEELMRDMNNG